jgi:citrate lyase synthetase
MADKNKMISDILGKVDEKILKAKINKALDMLKNSKDDELKKAIDKANKEELLMKLDEIDKNTIKSMNIDVEDVKKKVREEDFQRISKLVGKDGEKVVAKLKELLS